MVHQPDGAVRFLDAGDAALIVEFGDEIKHSTLRRVSAMNAQISGCIERGELPGLIETVPTFRSLALVLDPLITSPAEMADKLRGLDEQAAQNQNLGRHWLMPVHYGGSDGPDLEPFAAIAGLSVDQVIHRHQSVRYSVYMLGFQPGFGFMGDVDESIRQPRRREPRTRVPAGSVAVANQLTAIYPWESPGGWHLIGRCPIPLFNPQQDPPALFRAGDTVKFRGIDPSECDELDQRCTTDSFDMKELQIPGKLANQADTHATD